MNAERRKPLYGKLLLRGRLLCVTGLHIGAQGGSVQIGALDNPVVRDPITQHPYIPGSSLKGKCRALFERAKNLRFDRPGGSNIYRHECSDPSCESCRLFGSSGRTQEEPNLPGRVLFRDARLTEECVERLADLETGLYMTEWKWENGLDRITAHANPRQNERVPAGSTFDFELVYNVEADAKETQEDLASLGLALGLLEDDYLGGSGTRGYGKVQFSDLVLAFRPLDYYQTGDPRYEVRQEVPALPAIGQVFADLQRERV